MRRFTASFYFECNENSIKVFSRNYRMAETQEGDNNSIIKNHRFRNVFVQNILLIVSLSLILHFYRGKIDNVVSPYIYKTHVIDPKYKEIWPYVEGSDEATAPPAALRFQALAQAGCLDQQFYKESVGKAKFSEVAAAPATFDANFIDYFDAKNFHINSEILVCKCIHGIPVADLTKANLKDKVRDTCYDGKEYMSVFSVVAYDTKVHVDHHSREFYRFVIGLNFLLFYAWSLSAKSFADVLKSTEYKNGTYEKLILIPLYVVPFLCFVVSIMFFAKATEDIHPLPKTHGFDELLWAVFFIGMFLKVATMALLYFPLSQSYDDSGDANKKFLTNTFLTSASLRTFMDYFFVFGGTITLVYASIMAGVASLSSLCTLFILGTSLFYSVHASFFMRNQLDIVMSNVDKNILAYLVPTEKGAGQINSDQSKILECGFRPFANSLVTTRLSYLSFTILFLLSIVFMIRDTPLGIDSYLVSYQICWILVIFLTLCAFSYDFFNEIQQKIIKYADHDIIIYAIIFINFQVFYLLNLKA